MGVVGEAAPALAMRVATTRCTEHKSAADAPMEAPLLETVMIKIPALQPSLRAWLLEGPLSAHVPACVAKLRRGRYAPHTCERNLNALAQFAHWLPMCHLSAVIMRSARAGQSVTYKPSARSRALNFS